MRWTILSLATAVAFAFAPAAAFAAPNDPPPPATGFAPPDPISPPGTPIGFAQEGKTLTADQGDWEDDVTLTNEWRRCGELTCQSTGQTGSTYVLTEQDVGRQIKLRVRGVRAGVFGGSRTVDSPLTAGISPAPTAPVNVVAPALAGSAREGRVLSAIQGSWTGAAPITFSYDWLRCTEVDCATTGVTGTTYPLTEADVGTFVRVQETAANEGGSAAAYATSDLVSAQPKVRRLSPFPVVIIGGRVAGRGAVITTLAVRHAPREATIALLCRGRDCPFSESTRRLRGSSRMRIRALEVELRAGTVITIFIRKGRRLGKYTRIRIQRNAPPARLDRCVKPGSRRPVRCSTA